MQDITSMESRNSKIDCNVNNNSTIDPKSMETSKDIDENMNFSKMFDTDKSDKMSDLEEFDQVLSKYRQKQVSGHVIQLNTTEESNSIETFLEISIDIAENGNKTKSFQTTYEEFLSNISKNDKSGNENNKTELLDTISIISEESLKLFESDHSVELDAISLASTNIFTNIENSNERKSTEIQIDVNEICDKQHLLSNINFEANQIQKKITRIYDTVNLENEQSQNDINNTIFDEVSSECSYHSSDFEFITEEEAKIDGLIIHFRRNDKEIYNSNTNENFIEMYLPGTSDEISYQDHHIIPEGEEFFNLFRGMPAMLPDIFLENKAVIPSQCMSVEKETIGFDFRVLNKDAIIGDEEHQEEANETAKKILETYGSNKKRRSDRLL